MRVHKLSLIQLSAPSEIQKIQTVGYNNGRFFMLTIFGVIIFVSGWFWVDYHHISQQNKAHFCKFEVIKKIYEQKLLSLNQTFFVENDFRMFELIFAIDQILVKIKFW